MLTQNNYGVKKTIGYIGVIKYENKQRAKTKLLLTKAGTFRRCRFS